LCGIVFSWLVCACPNLLAGDAGAVAETTDGGGWQIDGWSLSVSLYTKHFDPEPEHVNNQKLIGPEVYFKNGWLGGFAVFDNSFGQPSEYVYMGYAWPLWKSPHWYVKLTGGLLHGYKDEHEDKIPLNDLGVAPAIVPSLGFRYKHLMLEAHLGGLAVITFTGGLRF
jgi:hypothetical protein